MRGREVGVEICLRLPVLQEHENARLIRRGMQSVVDAALLLEGGCAHDKQRLAQRLLLAWLGAVERNHRDFPLHRRPPRRL
jgi:hypothetical protein